MTSKIVIVNGEASVVTDEAKPQSSANNTSVNTTNTTHKSSGINLSDIEISVYITCETCDGYGTITVPAGDIKYDLQTILQQDNKGAIHDVNKIQSYLSALPKSVPGVTDRKRKEGCVKCGGKGRKQKAITLTELKELLK